MRRKTTSQGGPLSLWADDYLEPGERDDLGDRAAAEVAWERYRRLARTRPREELTEDDVSPTRPEVVDGPMTEAALAVTAIREAMITGFAMPYRDGGHLR
ncbi:hypothetical protein [Janibacter melonis]|uniref:hypothetical protein n=1 Tax=Janibacter melonis TaxID=262209 RepID=UPI00174CB738|nr:hypothetical protein [Janibacter melonis]